VLFLPKWLTQRDMDCCIKIVINSGYLTIASVHSLRSLGQAYGRISLRSKAASINLPLCAIRILGENEVSTD
jgi:hypothetical protein